MRGAFRQQSNAHRGPPCNDVWTSCPEFVTGFGTLESTDVQGHASHKWALVKRHMQRGSSLMTPNIARPWRVRQIRARRRLLRHAIGTLVGVAIALSSPLPAATAAADGVPSPHCAFDVASAGRDSLAAFRGSVVYLDFWASWCAPCRQSFPFMSGLADSFTARGLHVLALNLDEEPAQADAFIARLAPRFTIVRGDNTHCASAFEVQTMPSSYVIDRAGRVRLVHHGFRAGDEAALRDVIEAVLAETADLDRTAQ